MEPTRRDLFEQVTKFIVMSGAAAAVFDESTGAVSADAPANEYKMADHWWGMTIDIERCTGGGGEAGEGEGVGASGGVAQDDR